MDGILIVNKEAGMTSHDVVFKLRKILNIRKIGHSGTLDPNATGVLIILLGKATKILPFIEDIDKEYIATMQLGKRTFTDDIWGAVLETKQCQAINDFDSLLQSFKGPIKQYPPMVSSVKINGKKLYEYARNNETISRPLRDAFIYDIELLSIDDLQFRVHCSSGTYIRSLCVDIASKSNNLGCMSSLIRTKVGRFSIADAYTLAEIATGNYQLHSINAMLSHIEMISFHPIDDVYNGKKISITTKNDLIAIVDEETVVAIYKRIDKDVFSCVRGLW